MHSTLEEPAASQKPAAVEKPAAKEFYSIFKQPAAPQKPAAKEFYSIFKQPAASQKPAAKKTNCSTVEEPAASQKPAAVEKPAAKKMHSTFKQPAASLPPADIKPLATASPPPADVNIIAIESSDSESSSSQQRIPIRWRDETYQMIRPTMKVDELTSSDQVRELFNEACKKGKIDKAIADCEDAHHQEKLHQLKDHLFEIFNFLISEFQGKDIFAPFELKPDQVASDPAGVYGTSMGHNGSEIKYGESFICFRRITDEHWGQPHTFAFKMMDRNQLRKLIPDWLIKPIEELYLPGILYHSDHIERTRDLIVMQSYEGWLSAIHGGTHCITQTIFERFTQRPPRLNLTPIASVEDKARSFLQGLSTCKAHGLLSWPTTKSIVYEIANKRHREYIGTRIRKRPKGEFVTLHWIQTLIGEDNLTSWEDVVKIPPRQRTLDEFVRKVKPLLARGPSEYDDADNQETVASIEEALATITGNNKNTYVHPGEEELAEKFVHTFTKCDRASQGHVLLRRKGNVARHPIKATFLVG